MKYAECDWCLRNVGIINVWANLALFVIKIVCGVLCMSRALVADAVHSFTDVSISVVLWITLKVSAKPADSRYPYGRGNIEFITAGIIGVLLIGVAIFICVESFIALIKGELQIPGAIGILAAIISIVGNEILARHSFCIGKETNSPVLFANARENRADVYSSVAALVGITGARLGFKFLDAVGAIFVGILIGKFAIVTIIESIHGLLGGSIGRVELERTNRIVASVEGVEKIYSIKACRSGQKILFDLEIGVGPEAKLEETVSIAEIIKSRILRQVECPAEVSVYFK